MKQPEPFSTQIVHDKPPSANGGGIGGGPNSNVSGSSQNMSVASHRSKSAKNGGNFEDLPTEDVGNNASRYTTARSSAIKFYILGWGVPAALCVATALASVAIYGDNQL